TSRTRESLIVGFEILKAMASGVRFRKPGAELRWEGAGGKGPEEREAGGEDADADFDVEPEAGADGCTPQGGNRQDQYGNTGQDIRRRSDEKGDMIDIDAGTARDGFVPEILEGTTHHELGDDAGNEPGDGYGGDDDAADCEFTDWKDAVVEPEDGEFKDGHGDREEAGVGEEELEVISQLMHERFRFRGARDDDKHQDMAAETIVNSFDPISIQTCLPEEQKADLYIEQSRKRIRPPRIISTTCGIVHSSSSNPPMQQELTNHQSHTARPGSSSQRSATQRLSSPARAKS
ncbi:MAG: hypothetical protein Q9226_009117, partial [Calogaya cf. arnoldii]